MTQTFDPPRRARITRGTAETAITVSLDLDGTGRFEGGTGVGFFDHMLHQLARHSMIDLAVEAKGDTHIDDHHTVEDTGLTIGQALDRALGERRGIRRYAAQALPMDEALTEAAIDVSGRPFLVWHLPFEVDKIGTFDAQLVREFFQAFAMAARITLHVHGRCGANGHHVAESTFKAVARALRAAVEPDPRAVDALPSTKGTLTS